MTAVRFAISALLCLAVSVGTAQDDAGNFEARAEAAAAQIRAATAALPDANTGQDRVAALTEVVRAYEDALATVRGGLRQANVEERALEQKLTAEERDIAQLLGYLQATGRDRSPEVLIHPKGPVGALRAGLLLASVSPAMNQRIGALKTDLARLQNVKDAQTAALDTLREGLSGVQDARLALSQAIAERTDLPRSFADDPVHRALIEASAESLDDLAGIVGERPRPAAEIAPATLRKGALTLPVSGRVLRRAGEADAAGVKRPGTILVTEPQAMVTTPAAGTILFAGALLDYGNVIIIEPAQNVLLVFAGLDKVFGTVGQVIPAGDPIGQMGGDMQLVEGAAETNSAVTRAETLYIEVREDQKPVDPASWYRLSEG